MILATSFISTALWDVDSIGSHLSNNFPMANKLKDLSVFQQFAYLEKEGKGRRECLTKTNKTHPLVTSSYWNKFYSVSNFCSLHKLLN